MRSSFRPLLAALVLTGTALAGATPAYASDGGERRAVIVAATSPEAAAHAVVSVGGTVDLSLPIIGAVAARVSADGIARLESNPAVRVTPDAAVHSTSNSFDASALDPQLAAIDPGPD